LTGLSAQVHGVESVGNASTFYYTWQFNGFEAAQLLLKHGASAQQKTQGGLTPFDLSINSKTRELLKNATK
jgi:hypothetical protein